MQLTLNKSWHEVLQDEIAQPYVQDLKAFLHYEEQSGQRIYPPPNLVFNALSQTPFDQVKAVIVGQDPYHGAGQAHGLSFSVPHGVRPPPSLKNIFTELHSDVGVPIPEHGCLEGWAREGVLLLNATLTVRAKKPRSHYGKGWERFTDAILAKLVAKQEPIAFMLWGRSAQEKCERVFDTTPHTHLVLKAAHPSPYSVQGFYGCRHFSKVNDFLKKCGKKPIDWSI